MSDLVTVAGIAILAYAAGAATGYLIGGHRYKKALGRIVDASKQPQAAGFGPALEAADRLLGRRT